MTPDEFDELLGAYALDAVDGDERDALEAYLAANPRARDEVAQHREVASMLGYTGAPAPAGLWDKIVTALDDRAPAPAPSAPLSPPFTPVIPGDAVGAPAHGAATSRTRRHRTNGSNRTLGMIRRRQWALPVAGAIAAALVAFAVVSVRQDDRPSAAQAALASASTSKATLNGDGASVVRVAIDGATGYLDASELPALAADRTYQLWGVLGTQVVNLGVLGRDPETVSFAVDSRLDALAITDEVLGGVLASDRDPIVTGAV
jgi:anti-sigma factor RsiW